MQRFAREGYGVLMLEYRGYGGNPGDPSEAGLFEDAAAALRFVAARASPARRLVLYGKSLGTGGRGAGRRHARGRGGGARSRHTPASRRPRSTITRSSRPRWLVRTGSNSLSRIGQVRAPILMLHGARDGIIPLGLGEALFAAAPEPKEQWIAPQAGHADLGWFGALDIAVAFIERHVRQTEPASQGGADRRAAVARRARNV